MTPRRTFLKILVIGSTFTLMAAFVAFRSGFFDTWFTNPEADIFNREPVTLQVIRSKIYRPDIALPSRLFTDQKKDSPAATRPDTPAAEARELPENGPVQGLLSIGPPPGISEEEWKHFYYIASSKSTVIMTEPPPSLSSSKSIVVSKPLLNFDLPDLKKRDSVRRNVNRSPR